MKSDLFALKDEALSKKSGGMMPELKLEFLAVCNDYTVLKTVTTAVQKLGGQLHCVPSIAAGNDYIERRKMDGIVIDAALSGVLELVKSIREGRSNRQSCVFVCVE